MNEFKLSYTANEINEKLNKIDGLVSTINGIKPDTNGNIKIQNGGIIDVTELPTEDISESSFYRVTTNETVDITEAKLVFNDEVAPYQINCYPVDELPETGELFIFETDETVIMNFYYDTQNKEVYAYTDDEMGAYLEISAGWFTAEEILTLMGMPYGGIITDMADAQADKAHLLLNITDGGVKYDLYLYKDGWMQLPFAYEMAGGSSGIQWDGIVGDKFFIDVDGSGQQMLVKLSDTALSKEKLIGTTITMKIPPESGIEIPGGILTHTISESDIQELPGGAIVIVTISSGIEIPMLYSIFDLTAPELTEEIPDIQVGLYSMWVAGMVYVSEIKSEHLSSAKIVKIDSKFIDADLSGYAKTSEVDEKINQAIGNAIGGSY